MRARRGKWWHWFLSLGRVEAANLLRMFYKLTKVKGTKAMLIKKGKPLQLQVNDNMTPRLNSTDTPSSATTGAPLSARL